VLTGPGVITGNRPGLIRMPRAMVSQDMVLVGLEHHPLTATAAVVWNGDLPRPLQQVLFDGYHAAGPGPDEPARTCRYRPLSPGRLTAPARPAKACSASPHDQVHLQPKPEVRHVFTPPCPPGPRCRPDCRLSP
jgi:hypothetical protein